MRAVVTGVAGFIGSKLASALLDSGFDVTGMDRFSDYYDIAIKKENVAQLLGRPGFDLTHIDLERMTVADLPHDVDLVFHLAAQPGVRASWGDNFNGYVRDNVIATHRLFDCMSMLTRPPRVVYSSSSSVYGNAKAYPTRTSVAPAPISPYGVTKLAAEGLTGTYAEKTEAQAISLRYFTVYGPGQRPDMALSRLINAALNGSDFTVFGDGTQIRDFTFVDDVVSANLLAAGLPHEPRTHRIFNVAGGSELSLNEAIQIVASLVGRKVKLTHTPVVAGDPPKTKADTTETNLHLGWKPVIGIAEGIAIQVAWQQSRL